MEKVCVVRGEGFRLAKCLASYGFSFDREVKVWYRSMEVDADGTAVFDGVNDDILPERLSAEGFGSLLSGLLWKPKKITVAFE